MADKKQIKDDFDLIATIPSKRWSHNQYHYPQIISSIKGSPLKAMDVGCGKGALVTLLSKKCMSVDAIDISSVMIEEAILSNKANKNARFVCADVETFPLMKNSYDIIVSTDVVHHLDFTWFCDYVKQALRPHGQLILLDFYKNDTLLDWIIDIFSAIANMIYNLSYNHKISEYSELEKLIWKRHEEDDTILSLDTIKKLSKYHLPQATISRKLFWRYMLIWEKGNIDANLLTEESP